jgi:hypothetical protein
MDKAWLPAVVTLGCREASANLGRVWAELASDAVVHVVDKRTGRHRGWIVPELETGYLARRAGCQDIARQLGGYLEAVRDGEVFEVFDHQAGTVRGYLQWCPPDPIARLDAAIQFAARRSRTGRTKLRNIWPLEVTARPS